MKTTLLLLLSVVALASALNRTAFSRDGFDVIDLDYPTFVHTLHYNWANNKFYAHGSGQWRQINHGPLTSQFEAIDNASLIPYDQPFIDARLFTPNNTQELWAVGPAYQRRDTENGTTGYTLPITVVPPNNNATYDYAVPTGYTFYTVSIDDRNKTDTIVYLVGWGPGTGTAVDFMIVRARLSLTLPFTGIVINPDAGDVCFLHANGFHPYHSTYKPRVIHDYATNALYVISPDELRIFKVTTTGPEAPLVYVGFMPIDSWGPYSGATFDWYQDKVYIGFANNYAHPATVIEVDLKQFVVTYRWTFEGNHTQPRAIIARNDTLFIAFEGGPSVVKINIASRNILGYATLPYYLYSVYTGWDEGYEHVYFATHEERSKIFRLSKVNFCPHVCPYHGYCIGGTCQCDSPYTLVPDQYYAAGRCEYIAPPTPDQPKEEDKGAAIALGILWAITTIVAAAGWYLFYKAKGGGYQRVL